MTRSLPWPLPALLTWAAAWAVFVFVRPLVPWWAALLLACALGVLASMLGATWWRRCMIAAGFPLSWWVLAAGSMPAWGWLLPLGLLLLVYPMNAWRDAPVFPTPAGALDGMAAHIALPEGAVVLDAGCGAGDGLKALRSAWPQAQVHGVEWSWPLRWLSAVRCPWATVQRGDFWDADWSGCDLVYLFQRPESMGRAAIKAMGELAPGAWLVSLNFPLPEVAPTHTVTLPDGRGVYAYRAPWVDVDHASVYARDEVEHTGEIGHRMVHGHSLYPRKGRPGGRRRKP